jgi:2-polyprenyl-3-methyl-5-hydroxy-6-metoxy-1,4-benzoquinol methylase
MAKKNPKTFRGELRKQLSGDGRKNLDTTVRETEDKMVLTFDEKEYIRLEEESIKQLAENNFSSQTYEEVYDKLTEYIIESDRLKTKSRIFGTSSIYKLSPFLTKIYVQRIVGKGKNILEVACGDGFLAIYLARKHNEVTAIDISNACVDFTKNNAEKYAVNINVMQGDGRKLMFENNSFDYVISLEFVEHLTEADFVNHLREVRRVLKDNGSYIIISPHYYSGGSGGRSNTKPFDDTLLHFKKYTYEEMENILRKEEFEVKTIPLWLIPVKQPLLKSNYKLRLENALKETKMPYLFLCLLGLNKVMVVAKKKQLFPNSQRGFYRG